MNRFSGPLFVAASTVIVSLFLGCSTFESEVKVAEGPEGFGIDKVASVQSGATATKEDPELTVDCTEPLLISVKPEISDDSLDGFLLAAPGDCGSTVNCGWLVLTVLDANDNELLQIPSASSPIRVDMPVERLKDDTVEFHRNETVTFHIALLDADGAAVLTDEDEPVSSDLTVTLATDSQCP